MGDSLFCSFKSNSVGGPYFFFFIYYLEKKRSIGELQTISIAMKVEEYRMSDTASV